MPRDVWELDVFRRAYELSLVVHRASHQWPKHEQYGGVAEQLRRASKSVCALLAEGHGRQAGSDPEMRRYVVMSLGSLEEAKLRCRYAQDLGYLDPAVADTWQTELVELARMLQGLRKYLTTLSDV